MTWYEIAATIVCSILASNGLCKLDIEDRYRENIAFVKMQFGTGSSRTFNI